MTSSERMRAVNNNMRVKKRRKSKDNNHEMKSMHKLVSWVAPRTVELTDTAPAVQRPVAVLLTHYLRTTPTTMKM